jgi:ribosomal protein L15
MQFHTLKSKTKRRHARQVGRGGTRGKTSGRGTKGQNARAGHKKRPELRDFIKRVPKLRGRGKSSLKSFQKKARGSELKALLLKKKTKPLDSAQGK